MGLPQYDRSLDESGVTTDRGQVVMDAISDEELDLFRCYCRQTESATFTEATAGRPAVADFRSRNNWTEGDGSEEDIFYAACK